MLQFDKQYLQQQVVSGKLDSVFNHLSTNISYIKSKSLQEDVMQLASRWQSHQHSFRTGVSSEENLRIERNQITQSLLILLREIEFGVQNGNSLKISKQKKRKFTLLEILTVVASIVTITGISGSILYNKIIDPAIESPTNETTIDTTIRVVSNQTDTDSVASTASASKAIKETSPISTKPTVLEKDEIEMSGTVNDENGNPIDNAEVRIGSQLLITNSDGEFSLQVQSGRQVKVEVSKDGFNGYAEYEFPREDVRITLKEK